MRLAGDLVVQRRDQCGIIKEAGGKTQYGLPGIVLLRRLGDFKPVFQRHLRALRPFGNAGQPLAPCEIIRCLANGGAGDLPGIFQLAVFEKHLVAEGENLVIKGDARAAGLAGRRHLLELPVAPGAGNLQGLPLLHQRHPQQLADITVGDVWPAGGTGEVGQQQQGVAVLGEVAEFALAQFDGGQGLVTGLQGAQRRMEQAAGIAALGAVVAREQVKLGAATIVAVGQGLLGSVLEQRVGASGVVDALGDGLEQLATEIGVVVLIGLAGEFDLLLDRHRLVSQLSHLPQQIEAHLPALVVGLHGQFAIFEFRDFEQDPQGLAVDGWFAGVQRRLQRGAGFFDLADLHLAAGKQQAQLRIVRVAAEQVGEIGR